MFKECKINDKVFDYILQEWGVVTDVRPRGEYPITVQFNKKVIKTYTLDGRDFILDNMPILFWDEVEPITPPSKPLPKLEVNTKVIVWDDEYPTKFKRYFSHFHNTFMVTYPDGKTSWSYNSTAVKEHWEHWKIINE